MTTTSDQATASPPAKTNMKIDDIEYTVDTSQIPYLSSFVAFEAKARLGVTVPAHGPIALFSIALKGLELGYRRCFRSLPADLSQYHTLCETYDFLSVHVLGRQTFDQIFADIKAGKTDYELEYKRYIAVKGNKTKARDAAFKLLYLLLLGEFENDHKDAMKMFNAVLFVISHSATFKWRARTVVRMAYEERFVVMEKQRAGLDKWGKKGGDGKEDIADDVTTEEEESDGYYNSDGSWF